MKPVPLSYRGFYHVPKGTSYHVGNSLRGVRKAGRRKGSRKAIDLDLHCTKDRALICTHWPRPMRKDGFRAPAPRARKHQWRRVWTLKWAEVKTWRAAPGGYRISLMPRLLREAAKLGVRVEIEAKTSPQLAQPWPWKRLANVVEECGVDAQVKVLSTNPHAGPILRHAKAAGFTTIILPRGKVPKAWAPFIDLHRGPVRWK